MLQISPDKPKDKEDLTHLVYLEIQEIRMDLVLGKELELQVLARDKELLVQVKQDLAHNNEVVVLVRLD